ncbi:DUF1467 family protein [Parvularcula sp. IMCC14364]|uniref:DUF1467 family protein n=1 Tax=Parvularcula sp. IMCC14364 TaxID=3067902 RepID=UPI002740C20D|nr:DUF1467 family protein [Parvularcula sp. IMCC14364]
MSIIGAIIIYLMLWWVVFLPVLQWGVKGSWEDPDKVVKGTNPGAPQEALIWQKVKKTTWIAGIIWLVVVLIMLSGVIDFRE